ncbi:unnamed protein product [Acanthosepion pharaonis]|uniref:Uncharacterized protein n=1 Tax=Acanthosepion pharaonis TaxID=158019 RepID=A0A812DXL8_ACAPH|nr:unnamed protein product [Sepia pharaonis]
MTGSSRSSGAMASNRSATEAVEQADAIARGALVMVDARLVRRPDHASNVEMRPCDAVIDIALQELRRRDRAAATRADILHASDGGKRHSFSSVALPAASSDSASRSSLANRPPCSYSTDDRRAGQRGKIDDGRRRMRLLDPVSASHRTERPSASVLMTSIV